MISFLRELTTWLVDYYAGSTMILLAIGVAWSCLRQPIQRMVLAWATLIGLCFLIFQCMVPPPWRTSLRLAKIDPPALREHEVPLTSATRPPEASASHKLKLSTQLPAFAAASDPVPKVMPEPAIQNLVAFRWPDREIVFALGFLAGASLVLVWELAGLVQVRHLRSRGQPAPDFAIQELRRLVPHGMRSPILLVSPQIRAAVALGVWQPVIVLPQAVIESRDMILLRSLLAHELAHIRHGDLLLLVASRLLLFTLYAHPFYWWLRRRIRIDQEILADASAAEACGRQDYAESLVNWARQMPRPVPRLAGTIGVWESREQLTRRIAMLLNEGISIQIQATRSWKWGAGLAMFILIAVLSLVTLRPGTEIRADEPLVQTSKSAMKSPPVGVAAQSAREPNSNPQQSEPLEIVGTCEDEQGEPLAGVRLQLVFMNYDEGVQMDLQDVLSNVKGQFHFQPVDARKLFATAADRIQFSQSTRKLFVVAQVSRKATMYRLISTGDSQSEVSPSGLSELIAKPKSNLQTSGRTTLKMTFRPAGTLRGRIVDEQNRPLAGISVAVNQHTYRVLPGILNTVTDADGRYEITDAAIWDKAAEEQSREKKRMNLTEEEQFERYALGQGLVQHSEYPVCRFAVTKIPGTADVVLPAAASLEGRVTFQDTGNAAANVQVEVTRKANGDETFWNKTFKTDADGRFAVDAKLLPGSFQIKASLPSWPPVVNTDVQLKSGKNVTNLELQTGATIQGRVLELSSGKPVAFSRESFTMIQAINVASKAEAEPFVVNPDGTFALTVVPGKNLVFVQTLVGGGQITSDFIRWILVNNARQAYQIVDIAKGETKQIEMRLLRVPSLIASVEAYHMESPFEGDQHEQIDQIQQALESRQAVRDSDEIPRPLGEKAAVAAITELGGWCKTELIDGLNRVVELNLAFHADGRQHSFNVNHTDEGLSYVRKFPHLKSLILNKGQASDKGLENLRGLEQLESVCLTSAWGVTDAGIAHVAALPKLTRFCTDGAEQLTDESLRHLGRAANLRELQLDGGRFSDTGMSHLKQLKHLKVLRIGSAEATITDQGLAQLAGHVGLETLSLENSKITNAGLKHLHPLKQLKELDLTSLRDSGVTTEGVEALRKVLPQLIISNGQ